MFTPPENPFVMANETKGPIGITLDLDADQVINGLPEREIAGWKDGEEEPAVVRSMDEIDLRKLLISKAKSIDESEHNFFALPVVGFLKADGFNPMVKDGVFLSAEPGEKIYGFCDVLWDKEQYLQQMTLERFCAQYQFDQKKENELALAYSASAIFGELIHGGTFTPEVETALLTPFFLRRSWCEKDTDFLQLIPYVVFHRTTLNGEKEVFVYQRTKLVGEERLAGNYSIGIGGHINMSAMYNPVLKGRPSTTFEGKDCAGVVWNDFWETLYQGTMKELDEEVLITVPGNTMGTFSDTVPASNVLTKEKLMENTQFFIDYSGDDTNKVHLGAIIGVELSARADVTMLEEELKGLGWKTIDALLDEHEDLVALQEKGLESWSESIIRSVVGTKELLARAGDNEGTFEMGVYINMEIKALPFEDRWQVGGLARIFDARYNLLGTNILLKV